MSDELKTRLLVVDDEQSIRRLCMTIGNSLNFACAEAESAEAALARLDAEIPDLVLTDLKLPTQSGVELPAANQERASTHRSGHYDRPRLIESAVDAMKLGAYDYIEKPFRVEKCACCCSAWRKKSAGTSSLQCAFAGKLILAYAYLQREIMRSTSWILLMCEDPVELSSGADALAKECVFCDQADFFRHALQQQAQNFFPRENGFSM